MIDQQTTPDGSVIYRHGNSRADWHLAENRTVDLEAELPQVHSFLEKALGNHVGAYTDRLADDIAANILVYGPTASRPYWTFVSWGMSWFPMTPPAHLDAIDDFKRVELYLSLPEDWFEAKEDGMPQVGIFTASKKFWPVELMKETARFPHEHETWIWDTHTIPNADPPVPYTPHTRMNGLILLKDFGSLAGSPILELSDGSKITFLALVPLYGEEMTFKLNKGDRPLRKRLMDAGITDIYDPKRPSVVRKGGLRSLLGLN